MVSSGSGYEPYAREGLWSSVLHDPLLFLSSTSAISGWEAADVGEPVQQRAACQRHRPRESKNSVRDAGASAQTITFSVFLISVQHLWTVPALQGRFLQ
jgi:hypothetical protein